MRKSANEISDIGAELERLQQIEKRFEDFANSTRDFAFITMDLNGVIVGWNKGAEHMLGYSEAEIIGQPGAVFFTPEDNAIGEPQKEMAAAMATGRGEDDRWHIRKDGSRFWGSGVMTVLRDRDGNVRGFAKVMRDRTEQKKRTQELRASEERFRLLVENVRDCALFSVDPDGNISDWNPGAERIFGYTDAEVIGRYLIDLFAADRELKELIKEDLARAAIEDGASAESWLTRKDGTRFYARWVTNAIRDEDGILIGYMKVLRDETDLRKNEEERQRQLQRDRELLEGQFQLTNIALHRTKEELQDLTGQLLNAQDEERRRIARDLHDHLAQRIGLIDMKLSNLGRTPDGPAALQAELEPVHEQISELLAEVRDLSYRLHPATLEHLGLLPTLGSLVEQFRSVRSTPIHLETADYFEEGLESELRSALYRITEEALRNVQRHAGDVPVTITLYRNSGEVHLEIQDSGQGFSEAAIKGRRTLGLISMEERARLVGGTLELRSVPGEGTTLEVVVPVAKDVNGTATSHSS
ncbi:MAG: PAS domain S-box protein [Acidobacteriaceae bacterium]|nr:PAS domain S-box protein [Acidobacteriaceae bacterium]